MGKNRKISRRNFLRGAAFLAGGLAFSLSAAGTAAETALRAAAESGKTLFEYMKDRIAGVYAREKKLPGRNSWDNPEITGIYREFLGAPMSSKAERYLHRELTDRSAQLKKMKKKGLHPYKRLESFPQGYPFEAGE